MQQLKVITITHKRVSVEEVGNFHLEDTVAKERLEEVKANTSIDELMYLSTCNRVEFVVVTDNELDNDWLKRFFSNFRPDWTEDQVEDAVLISEVYEGKNVVQHLFNVASSIDSMVLGEREIITQVRSAFETSRKMGLTGDLVRLLIRKTIETAKEVYTHTEIATKPVSIVSLAHRKLLQLDVPNDARVIIIGSGQTNTNMARFLKKRKFKNFAVFNRTLENAQKLVDEIGGTAYALEDIDTYDKGFDVLLTCTGASDHIVTMPLYKQLLSGETDSKIVIDLAIPTDLDPMVLQFFRIKYIGVEELKGIAADNLKIRAAELEVCRAIISRNIREFAHIFKERQVELAMRAVPGQVKEIKDMAINTVFAKEMEGLDPESREVLEKVVAYMEKKYISMPMKMAKEIMLGEDDKL